MVRKACRLSDRFGIVLAFVGLRNGAFVDRTELFDGLLGRVGEEQSARTRTDIRLGRVMSVRQVLLAVVVDQHFVVLTRLEGVGGDDGVAPLRREFDGLERGSRSVPDTERAVERTR